MTHLPYGLRHPLRSLWQSRGLTFVAAVSVAIGVGVTAALVSVANAVLIKSLPYADPSRLVMIWGVDSEPRPSAEFFDPYRLSRLTFTPAMVTRWKAQQSSLLFTEFALYSSWQTTFESRVDVITAEGAHRLRANLATANIFSVLGVSAALGRTFDPSESDVAVLSYQTWRNRFASDPAVLGSTITLEGWTPRHRRVIEIVGVLPEGMHFDYPDETEIWLPLTWQDISGTLQFAVNYRAIARLSPGASIAAAQAAMLAFRDPTQPNPEDYTTIWLEPLHEYIVGPSRRAIVLVSALTVLVLLTAAVNAATVFAARSVSRIRDTRLRRALGAPTHRLLKDALVEAVLIATLAGAFGLAAMVVLLPVLRATLPADVPRIDDIGIDMSTVAAVVGAASVSALIIALVPMWVGLRESQRLRIEDTRTVTMSAGGVRLRKALLTLQFALVTCLLVVSSMLVRSFLNIIDVDKGFNPPGDVYVAQVQLTDPKYHDDVIRLRESDLLRGLRSLSHVREAAVASAIPLQRPDAVNRVMRRDGRQVTVNVRSVDPAYFDVMNLPLIRGRYFSDADSVDPAWPTVISQSLAEALYPGEDPIGKSLEGSSGSRIVGVVADVRARSLLEKGLPALYRPRSRQVTTIFWILVRSGADAEQVARDMRHTAAAAYPDQHFQRFSTLADVLDESVADQRVYAVISATFALSMLVLSGLGLSGHLSHIVATRARDLAVRSALGASTAHQRDALLAHVVPSCLAGVVIAVALTYSARPWLEPLLFEVGTFDPLSIVASGFWVVLVTACAVIAPLIRVLRIDVARVLSAT